MTSSNNHFKLFGTRVAVFVILLMFTSFVYHYYDAQYSLSLIGYKADAVLINSYLDSQFNEEADESGFIVRSPSCQIPNITAYHESIRKYIFKWKPTICSHARPLTTVTFDQKSGKHSIKIVYKVVGDYSVPSKSLSCCCTIISRGLYEKYRNKDDDNRFESSKPTCFTNQTELPKGTEFTYVTCSAERKRKTIYKNIHLMVANKRAEIEERNTTLNKTTKYSVLLFGIDSISRLNLIRMLPQTMNYVENRGWLSLEGYTKIGDNTFPNVMAILMGMTPDQTQRQCFASNHNKLDDCPIIWRNFSQNAYLTSYVEDEVSIGTFNFNKYGFLNSPTDYYTRPIMITAEQRLQSKMDGGMHYCLGQYPQAEYLFQYATEFVQRFHNRPYFKLFWLNSFSHNEQNMPSVMDARLTRFFQEIENYLNDTIVVFFSDHGMRFGKARETFVGWLEERMPFIYFHFPSSFREAYPEKIRNLKMNKNRLTSPYDFHATLQEILYGRVVQTPKGCSTCDSLLKVVPWNRSCEDAGITPHWCTCGTDDTWSNSTSDPIIESAVSHCVESINNYLKEHKNQVESRKECAVLTVDKIVSVISRGGKKGQFFKNSNYVIVFETKPSSALFEFTAQRDGKFEGIDSISRINIYSNQSSCVRGNNVMKKFCYCINSAR